jgi:hypothetical protein
VGRSFVKGGGKPTDILEKLNEMAGFAPNEEIQLFEVGFFMSHSMLQIIVLINYLDFILLYLLYDNLFIYFGSFFGGSCRKSSLSQMSCVSLLTRSLHSKPVRYEGRDFTRQIGNHPF